LWYNFRKIQDLGVIIWQEEEKLLPRQQAQLLKFFVMVELEKLLKLLQEVLFHSEHLKKLNNILEQN
jgi:hypothetical protein